VEKGGSPKHYAMKLLLPEAFEESEQRSVLKHEAKIAGVLSCFDRMLFRGYLPIMSGASMAQFLQSERVNCENLKHFLLDTAQRLK